MVKKNRALKKTFQRGEKIFFCQCEQSQIYPFCDGSHQGTGKSPVSVTFTEETKVSLCQCGHSKEFPYCDNSHRAYRDGPKK